jgi:hypothetical protein
MIAVQFVCLNVGSRERRNSAAVGVDVVVVHARNAAVLFQISTSNRPGNERWRRFASVSSGEAMARIPVKRRPDRPRQYFSTLLEVHSR